MSYEYANRKRTSSPQKQTTAAQPDMDALRSGAALPTREQMGRRVDLPDAMRTKMESAFGTDLSAVKLYESDAVREAGANAITQGSNIAFAPGMLDFTSFGGQSLLGHEISHVVSQARGEVTGGGFLNDRGLEARADREGALAAAGQQVAMPTAALSSATASAAAGPMQADKAEEAAKKRDLHIFNAELNDPTMNSESDELPSPEEIRAATRMQKVQRREIKKARYYGAKAIRDPQMRKAYKRQTALYDQNDKLEQARSKNISSSSRTAGNFYAWLADQREKKLGKMEDKYYNDFGEDADRRYGAWYYRRY